jgi:predicted DNA-binding transcriptional regulator AlpA
MSKFLRAKEVAQYLGIAKSTVYYWLNNLDDFPKPIKFSKRIVAWNIEELDTWIIEQSEKRANAVEKEVKEEKTPKLRKN